MIDWERKDITDIERENGVYYLYKGDSIPGKCKHLCRDRGLEDLDCAFTGRLNLCSGLNSPYCPLWKNKTLEQKIDSLAFAIANLR